MSYASIVSLKKAAPVPSVDAMDPKWVNLREYFSKGGLQEREREKEKQNNLNLDARLKEAAAVMRRRWDRWNADHGIEYDYDQEDACSTSDGEDRKEGEDENISDDLDFNEDYNCVKKSFY